MTSAELEEHKKELVRFSIGNWKKKAEESAEERKKKEKA